MHDNAHMPGKICVLCDAAGKREVADERLTRKANEEQRRAEIEAAMEKKTRRKARWGEEGGEEVGKEEGVRSRGN